MISIAENFLSLQLEFTDHKLAVLPRIWTLSAKNKSEVAEPQNPFSFALDPYCQFVHEYLNGPIDVLFLGINPSPTGMGRNGIPFGDIDSVINYLEITDAQLKDGTKIADLPRGGKNAEYSGKLLWGLIEELAGPPQNFFDHCFVHNYCPLLFTTHKNGRTKNVTPKDLADKSELEAICDEYLLKTLALLNVRVLVVMGGYLENRVKNCFKKIDPAPAPPPFSASSASFSASVAGNISPPFSASAAGNFSPSLMHHPVQEDVSRPKYQLPVVVKIKHPAYGQYNRENPEVWKKNVLDVLKNNEAFEPYSKYFPNWDATLDMYEI